MTEAAELKALTDATEAVGKSFDAYKKTNDEAIATLSKKGVADPLVTEKLAKMDGVLADLCSEKDKLVIRIKALAAAKSTGDIDLSEAEVEAKSLYNAYLRDGLNVKGHGGQEFFDAKYLPKNDPATGKPERKALSVISDPDGGYMVTADLSGRMVKKIFESSDMRRVASVQAIATDALEGIFDLGEAGYGWVGETAARPATSTPQIGKWRIPTHEMYAMPICTQKLLDDANFNPEQWLADKLAERFARAENAAFVGGVTNTAPRGFLTYGSGTTLPGTIEQVNSGTSAAVGADSLMDLVGSLKTAYRARAQFGMNRLTLVQIRKLKDSENRYLWEPGLNGATQQQVLGFNVNEFNDMPAPAASSLSICFADWAEFYQIVDRVGIRVLRDPYTNKPYVQFYATKRTGGDVLNFEAGKVYKLAT